MKVRAGDTLSRIARANMPAEVSLDQMLVALMRANPEAFIRGNVNLLKAGANLAVPAAEEAAAIPAAEARSVVALHSRDFNEYRQQLAAAAPRLATSARQSSGKTEATVSDKKLAARPRNRLSLSSGVVGRASAVEKSIASQLARMARERAAGLAGVAKEVSRLQEPEPAQGTASSPLPAGSAAAPGTSVILPSR